MAGTNRPINAGQRKVNAVASKRRAFRFGGYLLLKLFEPFLDVGSELIEHSPDDWPECGRSGFQPLFGDAIQHARFATEPGVTQRFPGSLVARSCIGSVEFGAKCFETGGDLRRRGDTKRGKGLSSIVDHFGHGSRMRESLHQSKSQAPSDPRTHFDARFSREAPNAQAGVPAACFAWAAIFANPAASRTAISARILRSMSTPPAFSPCMSSL